MVLIKYFTIIVFVLSVLAQAGNAPIKFSIMGCGPYDNERRYAMSKQLQQENRLKSSDFIVHLGDITNGSTDIEEKHYIRMKKWLTEYNKIPTYIVPGDNEWNDKKDPDLCWSYWMKHLYKLEANFKTIWKTQRQEIRPENFSFVHKGVLFIGLNLPGGKVHDKDEWELRHSQNVIWVESQLNKYVKAVRATVLFFQGAPSEKHASFIKPARKILKAFKKPVLLVHADHHKWIFSEAFLENNITRVQTDMIGPQAPLVQITILAEGDKLFQYDRRLNPADGFVKE